MRGLTRISKPITNLITMKETVSQSESIIWNYITMKGQEHRFVRYYADPLSPAWKSGWSAGYFNSSSRQMVLNIKIYVTTPTSGESNSLKQHVRHPSFNVDTIQLYGIINSFSFIIFPFLAHIPVFTYVLVTALSHKSLLINDKISNLLSIFIIILSAFPSIDSLNLFPAYFDKIISNVFLFNLIM